MDNNYEVILDIRSRLTARQLVELIDSRLDGLADITRRRQTCVVKQHQQEPHQQEPTNGND